MERFDSLIHEIRACAEYAMREQSQVTISIKDDGSVLTQIDLHLNERIVNTIRTLYPEAGIISEEVLSLVKEDAPMIFILDPIDGTDMYSQGSPAWCIALGILGKDKEPIGGIIAAPRWGVGTPEGLLLCWEPGSEVVTLNGEPFHSVGNEHPIYQITASSSIMHTTPFRRTPKKVRSFGSNILHMISPALYPNIQAAVCLPSYIWDIAGAHAILYRLGLQVEYIDGTPLVYDAALLQRELCPKTVLVGTEGSLRELHSMLEY